MVGEAYWVVLFRSVSYALMAEKILIEAGIAFKLIPVPKAISSDCGICLRITADVREGVLLALADKVENDGIRPLG